MRHLVDRIHITTHLAILDHREAVYVEKVEAPGFIKMNTWIGRRMEVHSTAVGKALLAYLDPNERGETAPWVTAASRSSQRTPTPPCRVCCRSWIVCVNWLCGGR
jgi:IclR family acetate operon transcriptional repressor